MGIRYVRVDVPWRLHEPVPGSYEWGERRRELDLARLFETSRARGLLVLVRPGPWLGEPHPDGGLPEHVAVGGAPLPVSESYRAQARAWLNAVSERVAPFVHPSGPVVGWIASTPRVTERRGAGGLLDRSAEGLAFYRRYLQVNHPALAAAGVDSPAQGPRRSEQLEACLAWVEAGEVAQRTAIADQLAARPRTLSEAQPDGAPLPALVHLRDAPPGSGADAQAARGDADAVWLACPRAAAREFSQLRLAGLRAADFAGACRIPAARSLGDAPAAFDPAAAAAVLAMSGVRALDLDSIVARAEGWEIDAPVRGDGAPTPESHARWRELFRLLDAISQPLLERKSDCLLLANRETGRLREACSEPSPLPLDLAAPGDLAALRTVPRPLGLRDHPELDGDATFAALFDGLRRAAIAFSVADTSISVDRLGSERVVLVPCFERMSRALAQRLFEWAFDGGTLVIGPRLPRADWSGASLGVETPLEVKDRLASLDVDGLDLREVDLLGGGEPLLETGFGAIAASCTHGRGRIAHFAFRLPWRAVERDADALARIVTSLLSVAGIEASYPASDPLIETELHEGLERRFLFVANPGASERSVSIASREDEALREVRGNPVHVRHGELLRVPARSVLLREIVAL
jgi:beta-galactosidase